MRLQKLLAQTTELSRRTSEKAIVDGMVFVNGVQVTELGTKVNPNTDKIFYQGKRLELSSNLTYIAYSKPRGELVTKKDPQQRKTIWDRLTEWKNSLNSAGRLDYNSEGLIILTNDGQLINKLTHPSHPIPKTYEVKTQGRPSEKAIKNLAQGVLLDDGLTMPADVSLFKTGEHTSWLSITIYEGRNRQIRRRCEKVGILILRLRRVCIGPVQIGAMRAGEWRHLTKSELKNLQNVN